VNVLQSIVESDLDAIAAKSEQIDCLVIGSGTSGVTTALELAKSSRPGGARLGRQQRWLGIQHYEQI
jgi:hypothetical protein